MACKIEPKQRVAHGDGVRNGAKMAHGDGVLLIADRLVKLEELAKYMFDLGAAAYNSGRKDGYAEGKAALAKKKDDNFELFKVDCAGNYASQRQEYEFIEFGILKALEKLTRVELQ